uniref:Uncharacterized protein n=1 Tax=Parascaris equorum TaxID=6256 RepID=A0A914R4V0_PAREQ
MVSSRISAWHPNSMSFPFGPRKKRIYPSTCKVYAADGEEFYGGDEIKEYRVNKAVDDCWR